MIFSEIYSVYYNTVAKILTAVQNGCTEEQLNKIVSENAFSDSVLTVLPALKSGRWPLIASDLSPVLKHTPTMPLTTLQRRWLKAISLDERIRLFDIDFPDLSDVQPLFTSEDFKLFDKYSDGDDFGSETYRQNFRVIKEAVETNKVVKITMLTKKGERGSAKFYPTGLEYSAKDDKFRIVTKGSRYNRYNMGKILTARLCDDFPEQHNPYEEPIHELTLIITNERKAMERAMLHFAHFEKQAERIDRTHYKLKVKYYRNDETEMVIRVLSFGAFVKVVEPQWFAELIKKRLNQQKSCGL